MTMYMLLARMGYRMNQGTIEDAMIHDGLWMVQVTWELWKTLLKNITFPEKTVMN